MSNSHLPGPGEDPDARTEEEFWDVCIDDEVFDEDEEQGEDPLEGK